MTVTEYKYLKYYAAYLTNNRSDADDLLHDAYLKALHSKDKYHENKLMKIWLFIIMKNIFIDQKRKESKVSLYDIEEAFTKYIYENIINKITFDEISRYLLFKYKEDIRCPIILYVILIKYIDIVKALHANENIIKSSIKRVREDLIELYKK